VTRRFQEQRNLSLFSALSHVATWGGGLFVVLAWVLAFCGYLVPASPGMRLGRCTFGDR